ncbi:MAG: ABC transporter permease, partial [Akkermansia sp.]|nr:ABC transporter permease [Akkermansia sp.]
STEEYLFYYSLHSNEYLFLSLVLDMFFGLTDSACEIIRDRNLIRRESNYKMFIPGYLLAKILVLTGIASLQCALYLWVSNHILEIQAMFWPHFGIMTLTAFIGIALSLMVSSLVRSEKTALNIVPLLLVPQILLAGALIRFEEMNEFCPESPGFIPQCVTNTLSKLRHRVAYQNEETHEISSKPIPLIAELCPLRYAFEMMFVTQANYNLWEIEYTQIEEHRKELRNELEEAKQRVIQAPTKEEKEKAEKIYSQLSNHIRLVNNAVLLLNSAADSSEEAKDVLRLSRKAALTHNEELLEEIESRFDGAGHSVESYFSNQKIMELREGVNLARKDNRISENRGFFLAPRQARTFSGMDHRTEEGSVSTLARNTFYLFIMGLCPILVAAWRLRRICRSG